MHSTNRSSQGTRSRFGTLLLAVSLAAIGCGGGAPEASPALISGMPRCDASLLHPHISVGSVAGQPGKTIVYVDGVMACVDDASRVDQILTQLEIKNPGILAR
ncbi:MAG: hypothetical protein JNM40_20660 [Myxococcales bacterium]|nr:hypothetical protein [Myxococcales bacterium]